MKATAQVPPSREVQTEAWLRAVRHLRAAGLAPVVPADISWQLYDRHQMRVAASVELPWTRRAA